MKLVAVCLVFFFTAVLANTEKAVFLASSTPNLPGSYQHLSNQHLDTLTPAAPKIRRSLPAAFPAAEHPHGLESAYLLTHLHPRQRYEVRVCWAAIQPTNFWINVYKLDQGLEGSNLLQSVTNLGGHQQGDVETTTQDPPYTTLLLTIHSAADFFTTKQTLMENPPAVDVDIILDPYIGNVFPKSLLPTALYILTLALGSWYLSGLIWSSLKSAAEPERKTHSD